MAEEHQYISASFADLGKDIRRFEADGKVPEGLGRFVSSSEYIQSYWFEALLEVWPESESDSVTPEEAAEHILYALGKVHPYYLKVFDLEGFFVYYSLTDYCPKSTTPPLFGDDLDARKSKKAVKSPINAPDLLQLNTLPVTKDAVKDGCSFTVFVEVKRKYLLPTEILLAMDERHSALANGNKRRADELLKLITAQDYHVMEIDNVEALTTKYEIMLRGFEESGMPNGVEAREKLAKMVDGKRLMIKVLYLDEHLRCVGDIYYNGICLQDKLCCKEICRG